MASYQRASTTGSMPSTTQPVVQPPKRRSLLTDYSKLSSSNLSTANSPSRSTSLRSVAALNRRRGMPMALRANAQVETMRTQPLTRSRSEGRMNRDRLLKVLDQATEVVANSEEPEARMRTSVRPSKSAGQITFSLKRRSLETTDLMDLEDPTESSHSSGSMEDSLVLGLTRTIHTSTATPRSARRSYHSLLDSSSTHTVFAKRDKPKPSCTSTSKDLTVDDSPTSPTRREKRQDAPSTCSDKAIAPPRRSKSSRALMISSSSGNTNSNSTPNSPISTAPMGRVNRRANLRRQKSQPLLPRQRSLKDLKKSKEKAKVRPSLSREGSFTTKQSEFAALEAIMGKSSSPNNNNNNNNPDSKRTIRKCKSLDASGFVASAFASKEKTTATAHVQVGERRPVALTSPKPTTRGNLAPVTMPNRGDRRRMMLQNRTQSMRHLTPRNSNKKADELSGAGSEHSHFHRSKSRIGTLQQSHSFKGTESRRGLMLRQGSFVAGSRMRTLRG